MRPTQRTAIYAALATLSILSGATSTTLARQTPEPSPQTQRKDVPKGVLVIASKEFIRLFAGYGEAVWHGGANGLENFAAPHFTARSGADTLIGRAAFTELAKYLDGVKGREYTITVSRLVRSGDTFTALVTESCKSAIDLNTPKIEKKAGARSTFVTTSWRSKQTWRKTPSGWKIAIYERDDTKEQDKPPGFRFDVYFKPELPEATGENGASGAST